MAARVANATPVGRRAVETGRHCQVRGNLDFVLRSRRGDRVHTRQQAEVVLPHSRWQVTGHIQDRGCTVLLSGTWAEEG